MGEGFGLGDLAEAQVLRADGSYEAPGIQLDLSCLKPNLAVGGFFTVECFDRAGNRRWVQDLKNGVTDAALNSVLDVYLRNQTQIASWYIGLVDNASFTAFASGDTMASHAGWIEATNYSESNRPAWSPGAAASGSLTNTSSVDFSITSTKTIRGVFLVSNNTKSGSTGTLFATAAFSGGNQTVNNGDTLKVTYTVSAVSG